MVDLFLARRTPEATGRLDDTSGAPQESFGFPIQLLADVALSPDKWFAAANLNYAPTSVQRPRLLALCQ